MMIQEEKVEIVEDEKPKALQNQKTNDVQKPEDVIPETRKKSTLLYFAQVFCIMSRKRKKLIERRQNGGHCYA